jgi:two-component system, LytTR family, sensor kinase
MNKPDITIRTLFRVAAYSTPFIAILSISPIFIIKAMPLLMFPKAVLIISFVVFSIWCLNILMFNLSGKFQFLNRSKVNVYILSYFFTALLLIAILFIIRNYISEIGSIRILKPTHSPLATLAMSFSINTVILILINLALTKEHKSKVEIENAQLKLKNSEAQNQLLKQQIHPHFLFNSLNTLKSLIKKSPDAAEDYLVKLSDFLRSSISTGNEHLAKVSDEVKLCLDYLEMQKIRYGNALQFDVYIPETVYQTGRIPAFSLQSLVENAIKHNALTHESPLLIKIMYDENRITVTNNMQPKFTSEISTGFGLTNLADRYKILSGDEIIIRTSDSQFSVSINIIDNENNNN